MRKLKLPLVLVLALLVPIMLTGTASQSSAWVWVTGPTSLQVVITNIGAHPANVTVGVCGSDEFNADGWSLSCKYMYWDSAWLQPKESTVFMFSIPVGKYTMNVAWVYTNLGGGIDEQIVEQYLAGGPWAMGGLLSHSFIHSGEQVLEYHIS